jgi:hypothetical protein
MASRPIPILAFSILLSTATTAFAGETGTAVVRIVAVPPIAAGKFVFSGTPAGELRLEQEPDYLSATGLAAGGHLSKLQELDSGALAAGYRLTQILCNDPASSGDPASGTANFQIIPDKTVTCDFVLTKAGDCICPQEGTWNANNLPGQMICSGSFNMTVPLTPDRGTGTLKIEEGCKTIVASGLSEDEATLVMHRNESCGYQGTVGGSQDGIPMNIEFTWSVLNDKKISGSLHSAVNQQGATCVMDRDYELDFAD